MEEADKVSSSAPDEAPHDVAMNEAAAVGPTQTDARDAEEEMIGKTSPPRTTEKTSDTQTNEITSVSKITEETSYPQTTEVTSSPQITEEISAAKITEETSSPQTTEVTSSPQITEEISAAKITEETSSPQITEVTSSPEPAEESDAPVSEVPVKRTSTEAGVRATDPVITEAAVTPQTAAELTPPPRTEAREERVSSSSADLSSEEKHPLTLHPSHEPEPPAAPVLFQPHFPSVLELLYWRDVRSSALVFGSSLFILLSLTCCSIISVLSYAALTLLSVTLTFRIYKGVLQAVQKSDEGHPFKWVLEKDVALTSDAVQRHSDVALSRINGVLKELRRLFLVEDLIDSLKFAVLLWVFTYVGAWFNGLTLLILGLVGAFSGPLTYEKHQTQIDQFISMVNSQMKDVLGKIQAKIPGAKKKPE